MFKETIRRPDNKDNKYRENNKVQSTNGNYSDDRFCTAIDKIVLDHKDLQVC